jgi:Mrp family chromosome partitioning ATPase
MTTEFVMPERRLSLNMPIGRGQRKVVEVSSKQIHPALMIAGAESAAALAHYEHAAETLLKTDWGAPERRVFVTSPVQGDGKTCTAFNLASALRLKGKPVLLLELNFAQPKFRAVLGDLRMWHGIEGALRGSAKPADSVFSMGEHGPDVCAVRDATPRSQVKHCFGRLSAFLDWCSGQYEWLVVDCPAVLSPGWNDWFRVHAAPALMVVREQQTPLVETRRAMKVLGQHLNGVLLNDFVATVYF